MIDIDLEFKRNLGRADRAVRTAIGVLLVSLALSGAVTGGWAAAAVAVALFQFIEAALGY